MSDTSPSPQVKLFVSYSWSNPDHENWVVAFAEELVSQGVHVILDKWDLKPGHDANAFMESMVSDPSVTKVIMVCDRVYAEKSNKRAGGAGTEAQILTPELYAKKDQDKYVAVIRERDPDGNAYKPVYYGSRIYIDLSDSSIYASEFERLLRWIWDKPLFVRPPLGAAPTFVTDPQKVAKIASSVAHRRALDAIRAGHPNAVAATVEYFDIIAGGLEQFRIPPETEEFDDAVVASVTEFTPYRNEIIELCQAIAQYQPREEFVEVLHRFLEKLLPYRDNPPRAGSWRETDFDNFKFIIHEIFLYIVAAFIKYEKFGCIDHFFTRGYYYEKSDGRDPMVSYGIFRDYLKSLDIRNHRLKLNRLSVRADMLNERGKAVGIEFRYVMAADFLAYLRSISTNIWSMWWPETLLYATRLHAPVLEMFARSKSRAYFERTKLAIGVADKAGLERLIETIYSDRDRIPKWHFESIDPRALLGIDNICTAP